MIATKQHYLSTALATSVKICNDLLNPDTSLGENDRVTERSVSQRLGQPIW